MGPSSAPKTAEKVRPTIFVKKFAIRRSERIVGAIFLLLLVGAAVATVSGVALGESDAKPFFAVLATFSVALSAVLLRYVRTGIQWHPAHITVYGIWSTRKFAPSDIESIEREELHLKQVIPAGSMWVVRTRQGKMFAVHEGLEDYQELVSLLETLTSGRPPRTKAHRRPE